MTAVRENGGPLLASYGDEDLGRRVSRTLGNGTSTGYGYDGASRLTALTLNGGGQPNAAAFDYNPAGQIASRTLSNDAYGWAGAVNADRASAVNGLNRYTASGAVVPTYDGRGNLTAAGGASYLYNGKNQLSGANGTYLYYDAAGRLDQVTQSNLVFSHNARMYSPTLGCFLQADPIGITRRPSRPPRRPERSIAWGGRAFHCRRGMSRRY
ncbi:hypothetical protein ASG29_03460 [Sphingomonas sp. Leaf412]|uniref:RHS repeat domain-containing protein n=1 Tax=Sphingomonas sp. Leaf412 TaxID=1736370 RepID=UPI0006F9952C|nr:RHS repeat domain-containing protein [Sphingomonas sp. Leaf412]KQT35182.1 hypothetical protein ASG29_03460 [Sphingomonas sp. Leaf412]